MTVGISRADRPPKMGVARRSHPARRVELALSGATGETTGSVLRARPSCPTDFSDRWDVRRMADLVHLLFSETY